MYANCILAEGEISMNNEFMRNTARLLAALMVASSIPMSNVPVMAEVTVSAEELENNITWSLKGGVLTISGVGAMEDYDTVSAPAPWHERKASIKSVIIENGITYIGSDSFSGCTGITGLSVAESVKDIGSRAFAGCIGLTAL